MLPLYQRLRFRLIFFELFGTLKLAERLCESYALPEVLRPSLEIDLLDVMRDNPRVPYSLYPLTPSSRAVASTAVFFVFHV